MSAAKLAVEFDHEDHQEVLLQCVRHIARPQPRLRCPECNSILYTRRHRLCGICGQELPDEVLFTAAEATRVVQTLTIERQKHRQWMRRVAS